LIEEIWGYQRQFDNENVNFIKIDDKITFEGKSKLEETSIGL
jgi:hypothetical protein